MLDWGLVGWSGVLSKKKRPDELKVFAKSTLTLDVAVEGSRLLYGNFEGVEVN